MKAPLCLSYEGQALGWIRTNNCANTGGGPSKGGAESASVQHPHIHSHSL